jgi:hypothetical protein
MFSPKIISLVSVAALVLAGFLFIVMLINKLQDNARENLLLELENTATTQELRFQQNARQIENTINSLDTESLRDRAREWMR